MMKKVLSMFLVLCMIVTMLPTSAMAEGIHTTIGGGDEITQFAPLTGTEKTVTIGTSIEDLELPETLTVTVRTAVLADKNPTQDSGSPGEGVIAGHSVVATTSSDIEVEVGEPEDTDEAAKPEWAEKTVDIAVTWASLDYEPDTEGVYVFTPVIEGYTVSAPLPEIIVTVGAAVMARGLVGPLSATTYDIWVGGVQVTSDNKDGITGTGISGTVTYDPGTSTLTLNNATITGAYDGPKIDNRTSYYGIYAGTTSFKIVLAGSNTITGKNGSDIFSGGIHTTGALTLSGSGSLGVSGGTGTFSSGIYNMGNLTIEGGTVTAVGVNATQTSVAIATNGRVTISDGAVDASANTTANNSYGIIAMHGYTIKGGTVTTTGKIGLNTNVATNPVTISGGKMTATGSQEGIIGAVTVTGGTVTTQSDAKALFGTLTTSDYTGCTVTASTQKDGSSAAAYNAADLATYKYIKVEPGAPAPNLSVADVIFDAITAGDPRPAARPIIITNSGGAAANPIVVTASNLTDFEIGGFGQMVHAGGSLNTRTIQPKANLAVGTHTATITVTYDGGRTVAAQVSFVVNAPATTQNPTPNIQIDVVNERLTGFTAYEYYSFDNGTGWIHFGDSFSNLTNLFGKTLYIIHKGNGTTTSNSPAQTLPIPSRPIVSSSDYVVQHESIQGANNGRLKAENANFEYSANNGTTWQDMTANVWVENLAPGNYLVRKKAVAGSSFKSESVTATVNAGTPAATYTITANPTTKDFGSLTVGYSAPVAQTVIITNTGNTRVTLTQPAGTNYTIGTLSSTTLAAGGTATFTVTPKAGLVVGNYNETLTVSTNHSTNAAIQLNFSVTATPTPTYSVTYNANGGTGAMTNSTATQGVSFTLPSSGFTVPSGKQFKAWAIGSTGGTQVDAGGTYTFTGNTTVYAIWEDSPVTNHTVTVNGSYAATTGAGSYAVGTTVTLDAGSRSNYTFIGWTASGVTLSNANSVSTSFTMPENNVAVTANWSYNGGGGGSGSGGSGSAGSSNDNSSPVIVTPPTPGSKDNVTVSITDKAVTDAFDKALAEAKKNGTEQNGITVVLRMDTSNKTGSHITINLPKVVQDTIIAKKIVNTIVVVDNPDIRVGMDLATVKEINKQAKSDVNITATRTDSGKLTGEAKKAIGSRPVFDLEVNYGNGKAISSFGAGRVSVTIPYTLGTNEKAGNVQAVYVDSKGKVHWLVNSVYDSVEKVLRFSTNHFSTYGIGYKQTDTAFTDMAGHWAKEDIEFVVSRGLFSGTSTTTFSPNMAMTREMFVTALGRLANADVTSYTKSSFTDLKSDAYYMGYIEWANKNNIVNGVGNEMFAPDQSITREQMAVIIQNYTKVIGFTLPKVHTENIFSDNAKINTYAKDAVKQMQMAGAISGKKGNLFDAQGTATRAEVSAVLRRFIELARAGQ